MLILSSPLPSSSSVLGLRNLEDAADLAAGAVMERPRSHKRSHHSRHEDDEPKETRKSRSHDKGGERAHRHHHHRDKSPASELKMSRKIDPDSALLLSAKPVARGTSTEGALESRGERDDVPLVDGRRTRHRSGGPGAFSPVDSGNRSIVSDRSSAHARHSRATPVGRGAKEPAGPGSGRSLGDYKIPKATSSSVPAKGRNSPQKLAGIARSATPLVASAMPRDPPRNQRSPAGVLPNRSQLDSGRHPVYPRPTATVTSQPKGCNALCGVNPTLGHAQYPSLPGEEYS